MNAIEREMVELLIDLRDNYSLDSVKMEFEGEGARLEEGMRFKEVTMAAGLPIGLKIGGGEAITDMHYCVVLGVRDLIAPLLETAFSMRRYLQSVRKVFTPDQREDMEVWFNLETVTAFENFSEMLELPEADELDGVIFGRGDLSNSLGLRGGLDDPQVLDLCLAAAAKAKAKGKRVCVGGVLGYQSMPFFKAFPSGHLDKFQTPKVVFACPGALENDETAFRKASRFELLWLRNKKQLYTNIANEDEQRLARMEQRLAAEEASVG